MDAFSDDEVCHLNRAMNGLKRWEHLKRASYLNESELKLTVWKHQALLKCVMQSDGPVDSSV
jgi:hypothetical protein